MKEFLKQKNKKKGFTLIETLVALAIFSISIIGMMTVLSSGLTDTISAKNKLTATFLAQEGIEYMRNLRDTYVLYDGTVTGWSEFLSDPAYSSCGDDRVCFFNDEDLWNHYNEPYMPIKTLLIKKCEENVCPFLYYNESSGKYNSLFSGTKTSFVREIRLRKIGEGETKVISTVKWGNNKSISLSESLFNWTE